LIRAREFGATLFMPKSERTNLEKGSIPIAVAREQSGIAARES